MLSKPSTNYPQTRTERRNENESVVSKLMSDWKVPVYTLTRFTEALVKIYGSDNTCGDLLTTYKRYIGMYIFTLYNIHIAPVDALKYYNCSIVPHRLQMDTDRADVNLPSNLFTRYMTTVSKHITLPKELRDRVYSGLLDSYRF